jgi:hypothetical protein
MKPSLKVIPACLFLMYSSTAVLANTDKQWPKPNPYLADTILAITHVDPAATDSYPYTIPKGIFNIDLAKTSQVVGGPVNIITLNSTSADYMWGVSSAGVTYIDKRGTNWLEVARASVPDVAPITAQLNQEALGQPFRSIQDVENAVFKIYKMNGFDRISGGVYSVVDKNNVVYANYNRHFIYAFALNDNHNPSKGIKIIHALDFQTISKDKNEWVAGVSMTYDGYIILLGNRSLTIVDRALEKVLSRVEFAQDEYVSNSIAVDEHNGIYVASDKLMRKIVWDGKKLSSDEKDGAWSAPYDTGEQPPVVKVGTGTGSTPTLMGFGNDADKLVVITDGSDHMNLVAFWRDAIPADFKQKPGTKSPRIADQIPVTCGLQPLPKFIQSEQSVVVKDYGAFVVNNIGTEGHKDLLVGVLALGPIFPPAHGVERFQWDVSKHQWHSAWTNADAVSTSMVPVVSIPSNIVLMNGYTKERGWEVTGLDWDSGQVVHRTLFGQTNFGNGAYAIIELINDNTLIFNSVAGPYRINYPNK